MSETPPLTVDFIRSVEDFSAMDSNRPFSTVFAEMLDLANNEYQKTLHEVVFTT